MSEQYFIRLQGRVKGPYSVEKLKILAKGPGFSRLHEVSTDAKTWTRAAEYPQFFPERRTSPPQGTSPAEGQPPNAGTDSGGTDSGGTNVPGEGVKPPADPPDSIQVRLAKLLAEEKTTWYYSQGKRDLGPVTSRQLQSLAQDGQLTAKDEVICEGLEDWVFAGDVPNLLPKSGPSVSENPNPIPGQPITLGASKSVSSMAIASLVLGLLGTSFLFLLGSILAVIFGHVALKQIRLSENRIGGRGLAIAGLSIGYFVLIVTAIAGCVIFVLTILDM